MSGLLEMLSLVSGIIMEGAPSQVFSFRDFYWQRIIGILLIEALGEWALGRPCNCIKPKSLGAETWVGGRGGPKRSDALLQTIKSNPSPVLSIPYLFRWWWLPYQAALRQPSACVKPKLTRGTVHLSSFQRWSEVYFGSGGKQTSHEAVITPFKWIA